jgi:hypothetical protein
MATQNRVAMPPDNPSLHAWQSTRHLAAIQELPQV